MKKDPKREDAALSQRMEELFAEAHREGWLQKPDRHTLWSSRGAIVMISEFGNLAPLRRTKKGAVGRVRRTKKAKLTELLSL